MSSMSMEATSVVEMQRVLSAPIKTVWGAFTESEPFSRWGVGQRYDNLALDLDVRPGGVIHHRVRAKQTGEVWTFRGVYLTVETRKRLVYTFDWKTDWREEPTPSEVEIRFGELGDKTEIKIVHSKMFPPGVESTESHWTEFLETLETLLQAKEIA